MKEWTWLIPLLESGYPSESGFVKYIIAEFVDAFPASIPSKYPSVSERRNIADQGVKFQGILKSLGLSDEEIQTGVSPFFQRLEQIIKALPEKTKLNIPEDGLDDPVMNWLVNKWQFDRLTTLLKLVDEFVSDSRELYKVVNDFTDTVNMFLEESGKVLQINRFGMEVTFSGLEPRPPTVLSSGEQQLLVLLTHLAFNPDARHANVLIIDEPELSLHISWQEMFADALMKANPTIQAILATHSPSIILDRDEKCIELLGR